MINLVANIQSLTISTILAVSSSVFQADKLPSPLIPQFLQEFLGNNPIFPWLSGILAAIALLFATVTSQTIKLAALTGNLQKIIDFCQKNLFRKQAEISEEKLLKFRKQLLKRLESDISIRIADSLHNQIKIDLQMEEQRQQVGRRTWDLIPEDVDNSMLLNRVFRFLNRGNHQITRLKSTQKIINFFDRNDIHGKLLILGEPGAGKTTELLSLAQDLIQQAVKDENAPMPIIFELSTWKNDLPIRDWLIEQLSDIYQAIPKAVAEKWIKNQQLIPLLDGLDELGLERENKCIIALNQFLASNFRPGLVVCCRWEEYKQAPTQLEQLNGAIYLQSLSDEQIKQYLNSINRSRIWNETIINKPDLLELVRKPLFLTMLVVAYQGRAIGNESELFDAYIDEQFKKPENQGTYPPKKIPSRKQTLHYLVWLAKKLEAKGKTEFLIEELQPKWIESTKQRVYYRLIAGFSVGLVTTSLIGGLITSLTVELWGWILGLMFGLLFGLVSGLAKIEPVEKLEFDFQKIRTNWIIGLIALIVGLNLGLIIGLIAGEIFGWIVGLSSGLIWWLIFSLSIWLSGGLHSSKIENQKKDYPNQGIKNSWKNSRDVGLRAGLISALIIGLSTGLIFWLNKGWMIGIFDGLKTGLILGLYYGVMSSLLYGLLPVIQHFILRIFLWFNGDIPWDYATFLSHAAKHRFIQEVGGRYRFIHNLLRKNFARMPLN